MGKPASGVRIRQARVEDAGALAELATQLGYPSAPDEMAARLRLILPQPDHSVLVAEADEGRTCGFAHVSGGIALQSGVRAELHGLVTDESLRGRGIGARLVEESERWARAKGFPTLCVRCNLVRTETHRFYERLGYTCSKTQKYFRKSLDEGGQSDRT
jgi:GNAT superfamily N-acetyltransferase